MHRCKEIISHYGLNHQLDKTVEECAELIVAINHYRSGRISINGLITEIADVLILTEQLKSHFPAVNEEINRKLDRTLKRMQISPVRANNHSPNS